MGIWAIDLDGVVWRGAELVPGSDLAVRRLLGAGHQVVFCTNHAQSPAKKQAELATMGVPECPVVTSAEAAAAACRPGDRVLAMGDPTLIEVFAAAGLAVTDVFELPDGHPVEPVDVVVVGASTRWDRSRVGMTADAVRDGARFLATNDDPTYPVDGPAGRRLLPGNGALVAAVATAAGRPAEVTGKPHAATASLLVERYGPVDVVVGDKPETDGGLAATLGARFGLVLSGVTSRDHLPVEPEPWKVAVDLASLVDDALVDEGEGAGDPAHGV